MVFSIFPIPPLLSIIIQFHVFVGFMHTFVFFPIKRIFRYFSPPELPEVVLFVPQFLIFPGKGGHLRRTEAKHQKHPKSVNVFSKQTIKWDCVDPKCFDRKFGRANTQKANSHNTAAWSLILTTGSVFCVSVASFVFTIYRILLTH